MNGAFSDKARAAIYEAAGHRCVGCGSAQITAQHRRARGMGGTSRALIGSPANGVALCGDGVRGCHGWAEAHPVEAERLGWRVNDDDLSVPWWTRFGWQQWVWEEPLTMDHADGRTLQVPGMWLVAGAWIDDYDRPDLRADAITVYRRALKARDVT